MNSRNDDWLSSVGSQILAILRLFGFVSLIVVLLPAQFFYRMAKPGDPYRIGKIFYSNLLKALGFRVRVHGAACRNHPTLYVSNHSSYLDIPILGSLLPAAFVAKSDVADWPFFGFMAKLQRTVFVQRQIMRTGEQANVMRDRLAAGESLILFPEGTSSDGRGVLPFKSSFFSLAENIGDGTLSIQPISVTCSELEGLPVTRALRSIYAWYGDMTLVGHLWNVFRIGTITVDVVFHPAVTPQDFPNRKVLAATCQEQVARGIERCITGRLTGGAQALPSLPAPAKA